MKRDNKFLYLVHSSPIKNTAIRVKESYEKFFKQNCCYPNFRLFKKKWFSLFYDEPNKGFKLLDNRNLRISLGKNESNKQMYAKGYLREVFILKDNEKVKNFRLCKQQGNKFYAIFTIEKSDSSKKEVKTWIAIDPNIREFTCKECNTTILRDINSAINIARKDNLEPINKVLNKIIKKGYFKFDRYRLEGV